MKAVKKQVLTKHAYVKRRSTAASTSQSHRSKNFKTFYPPEHEKLHHMTRNKLPKIKRFNEDYEEVASTYSKTGRYRLLDNQELKSVRSHSSLLQR